MHWSRGAARAASAAALATLVALSAAVSTSVCGPAGGGRPYLREFGAHIDISDNDTSRITIFGIFLNPSDSGIDVRAVSIPLGSPETIKLDALSVSVPEGGRAEVSEGPESLLITLILPEPVPPGGRGEFQLSYVALPSSYVKPWMPIGSNTTTGEYRMFSFNLYNPNLSLVQGVTDIQVTVLLPRDALLTQLSPLMNLFYPNKPVIEANLVTRRTQVSWTNLTVVPGEGRLFIVTYSLLGTPIPPTPPRQSSPGNSSSNSVPALGTALVLGSNGLAAMISAVITYLILRRRLTPSQLPAGHRAEAPKTILSQLSPEEMRILETVRSAGGSVAQRDVPSMVGFSKSKVSRMLKRMEELGLIRRTTLGRTKLIELSPTASELMTPFRESEE